MTIPRGNSQSNRCIGVQILHLFAIAKVQGVTDDAEAIPRFALTGCQGQDVSEYRLLEVCHRR